MHLLEFGILVASGHRGARADHPHEPIVELVLDADERRGDVNEQRLVGLELPGDDFLQALGLKHDAGAQLAQAQHAQRVGDLAQ